MKRLLIIIVLLVSVYSVMAQSFSDPNTVALPSVNNKFFVSNTNYDVSLYTGTNSVSIPIYSIASKSLTIPVSLSYTGGRGIKVQDIANYVGLGWQLNGSGSITRIVRGLPDDQANGYVGSSNASGSQIVSQVSSGTVSSDLMQKIGAGQLDGEPDIYSVRTPFFSFQFVLDEHGKPVFPNNTGFQITSAFVYGQQWTVTDDQGNKYYFGSSENSIERETTKLYDQNYSFISSWYLDKIVAFNNSDRVDFSYILGSDYSVKHYLTNEQQATAYGAGDTWGPNTKDVSSTVTYNGPKYLSNISTSMGEVDFGYQFDRRDVINAARLTNVSVYAYDPVTSSKGGIIKNYEFNYSYFGDPSSDPEALRLKLNYINLYGSSPTDPPIKLKWFDYETSTNLPARNSVEFDYWGYYNVNASGTALIPDANKNPDLNRTRANVLTAVHDIAGESLQFQYELNKYNDATSGNTDVGGLRVKQISKTLPTGENIYTQYVYELDNGTSTGQVYNTNYKNLSRELLNYITLCNINGQWGFCGATSIKITVSENLYNTYDLNGVFVGYSSVKVVNQNGGYQINEFTNFSDFPDAPQTVSGSTPSYQTSSPTSLSYKRGLLRHTETHAAGGYKLSEVINNYTSLENPVSQHAYGISPIPVYQDHSAWTVTYTNYNVYSTNIENYVLSQSTQRNYDQIDQSLYQETVSNYTYSNNKRLVRQVASTDSKGNIRSKTNYYPEDSDNPYLFGNDQSMINLLKNANKTSSPIHSIEKNNATSVHTHYTYVSLTDGKSLNELFLANQKTYLESSPADATIQQFQYDLNTSRLIATNKLGGPFHSALFGYHNGYIKAKVSNALNTSSLTFIQGTTAGTLQFDANNPSQSVNIPISGTGDVSILLSPSSGNVQNTQMEYELSGPANYSGVLCASTNNSCGANSSRVTISNVPPGNYSLGGSVSTDYQADVTGTVSVRYSYPTIQAATSASNEFFYEGFEEHLLGVTGTPFAGKRYYYGAYTVPFVIPNSRAYQIDYHYLLNGQWHAATKPYQNNMVLNDGSGVDEVRVYPVDAQINTYTYDPLIGITSEADSRNRFTFYEYDNFGRLKYIRDNDKNIIKRYEYAYQTNLAQTCPQPVITGITNDGLSITVSYIAPVGCTGISYTLKENWSGNTTTTTAGRVGVPITMNISSRNQSYTVTITSYSADCSLGVSSTQVVTVPQ